MGHGRLKRVVNQAVAYSIEKINAGVYGTPLNGRITGVEFRRFCRTDGYDALYYAGEDVSRMKHLVCGTVRRDQDAFFPMTYWRGTSGGPLGKEVKPIHASIIPTLMMIDMEYGDKDGVTTVNEIVKYRIRQVGAQCNIWLLGLDHGDHRDLVRRQQCKWNETPESLVFLMSLMEASPELFAAVALEFAKTLGVDTTKKGPQEETPKMKPDVDYYD